MELALWSSTMYTAYTVMYFFWDLPMGMRICLSAWYCSLVTYSCSAVLSAPSLKPSSDTTTLAPMHSWGQSMVIMQSLLLTVFSRSLKGLRLASMYAGPTTQRLPTGIDGYT